MMETLKPAPRSSSGGGMDKAGQVITMGRILRLYHLPLREANASILSVLREKKKRKYFSTDTFF